MSGCEDSSHACKFPLLMVARRPFTFQEQIFTVLTAQVETEAARGASRHPVADRRAAGTLRFYGWQLEQRGSYAGQHPRARTKARERRKNLIRMFTRPDDTDDEIRKKETKK